MSFNSHQFTNRLKSKNGISRRTHFQFEAVLPSFLRQNYTADHLTLLAVSANLPTTNLTTTDLRRSTISNQEPFPTNIQFGDLSVTFLSDGQGKSLTLFRDWIDFIFPTRYDFDHSAFRLPYKNEYATTAVIKHYDPENNTIVDYKFEEMYPAAINDIPFNWGAFDDLVTVSVDFKYTIYSSDNKYTYLGPPIFGDQFLSPSEAPNNRIPASPIIKP